MFLMVQIFYRDSTEAVGISMKKDEQLSGNLSVSIQNVLKQSCIHLNFFPNEHVESSSSLKYRIIQDDTTKDHSKLKTALLLCLEQSRSFIQPRQLH